MSVDVKICGITNSQDALAAQAAGADYLGFVLYERSPRYVSAAEVRAILEALEAPMRAVGVFVNVPVDEVVATVQECGLYAAQLHGDEQASAFADVPVRLWRAVRVDRPRGLRPDPSAWKAERLVVDADVTGAYGGTGQQADWDAARELARKRHVMLAGGLTPENVGDAIRQVRPMGVDVSSGVECRPGRKDPAAMAKFLQQVKELS